MMLSLFVIAGVYAVLKNIAGGIIMLVFFWFFVHWLSHLPHAQQN
jgi:hypothetical protein